MGFQIEAVEPRHAVPDGDYVLMNGFEVRTLKTAYGWLATIEKDGFECGVTGCWVTADAARSVAREYCCGGLL